MLKASSIFVLILSFSLSAYAAKSSSKYQQTLDQMRALQAKYPGFSSLFSIGENECDFVLSFYPLVSSLWMRRI